MTSHPGRPNRIWWFAFGYFASYVPYTYLTKQVSDGLADHEPVVGASILPLATFASVVGMFIFITLKGWWKYANHVQLGRVSLPMPRAVTFMSGISTAAIVTTTTLAYTFEGISIIFAMLLMRGGLLLLGPIVDRVTGRPFKSIPWYSWTGSGLALLALVIGFAEKGGSQLTLIAAIDIGLYLIAYFFRLRWMTKLAKKGSREDDIAFFVEEQMVATPLALSVLAVIAASVDNKFGAQLSYGFVGVWEDPMLVLLLLTIGIASQGTGIFGALILLEPQENAYTVPVNRASSVLAGLMSTLLLMIFQDADGPSSYELVGALVVVAAILVLAWPGIQRYRKRRAEQAAVRS